MNNLDKLRLISYCGLYCPKCHKMKISSSARSLLDELLSAQDHGATYLQNDSSIKNSLDKLIGLECTSFCREYGDTSPTCSIKVCCHEHGVIGCWECPELYSCNKLTKQFLDNNCKLRELGIEKYIEQYR